MEYTCLDTLRQVYAALNEKGYSPIDQIVGYILSEDPTYITNHAGARQLIARIDRYDLLHEIVRKYFYEQANWSSSNARKPPRQ